MMLIQISGLVDPVGLGMCSQHVVGGLVHVGAYSVPDYPHFPYAIKTRMNSSKIVHTHPDIDSYIW
jgi:hypothetical protein